MERRHLCASPTDRSDQIRALTVCLQMENAQVKSMHKPRLQNTVLSAEVLKHGRIAHFFISVTVCCDQLCN